MWKMLVYGLSLISGYFLYHKVMAKSKLVSKGISFDLGVNELSVAMLIFFAFISFITYFSLV